MKPALGQLRLGIIGTGFGGKVHLPAFRSVSGVEVVGAVGSDPARSERFAREHRLRKAYRSWQELIEDPEISAVSVAAPPACHKEIVLAAAARRKAVLCEKPFGLNPEEAGQMLSAAESAKIPNMVDFMFRFSPERILLQRMLAAGEIGRVIRANVEWTLRGRADRSPVWGWQFDPSQGGGVLPNFGSHVVDYIEWLLGPVETVGAQLAARRSNAFPGRRVAEDTLDMFLQLRDGTPVSVSISTAVSGGRGHWLSVYGEKGALIVANPNLNDVVLGTRLYRASPDGGSPEPVPVQELDWNAESKQDGRLALLGRVAAAFAGAAQSGSPAAPGFREGLRAQRILQAVRQSHETGTRVRVGETVEVPQ